MIKKLSTAFFIIVFLMFFLFVISLKPFASNGKEEMLHDEVKDQSVKSHGSKVQVSSTNYSVQKGSKNNRKKLELKI